MTVGRKPKPAHLKIVEGNPGGRAIPEELEVSVEIPEPPAHLLPAAVEEWNRLGTHLSMLGVISQLDRAAFAMFCQAWARHIEAEEKIKETSGVTITKTGYPIINPWVSISRQSVETMRSLLSEFGLSPAARARMAMDVTRVPKKTSPAQGRTSKEFDFGEDN